MGHPAPSQVKTAGQLSNLGVNMAHGQGRGQHPGLTVFPCQLDESQSKGGCPTVRGGGKFLPG